MPQELSNQGKLFLSLYFDEDVSAAIVKILQAHGFDLGLFSLFVEGIITKQRLVFCNF